MSTNNMMLLPGLFVVCTMATALCVIALVAFEPGKGEAHLLMAAAAGCALVGALCLRDWWRGDEWNRGDGDGDGGAP